MGTWKVCDNILWISKGLDVYALFILFHISQTGTSFTKLMERSGYSQSFVSGALELIRITNQFLTVATHRFDTRLDTIPIISNHFIKETTFPFNWHITPVNKLLSQAAWILSRQDTKTILKIVFLAFRTRPSALNNFKQQLIIKVEQIFKVVELWANILSLA